MQKCKECSASWDVKRMLDVCPFCGANLIEKTTADSIEAAFQLILERHGQDVFKSNVLLGLLGDYAPLLTKERKLVKVAVESGAYKALCTASVAEREHVLNKYVALLTDSYFIDETWARKALMWCVSALAVDAPDEIDIEKSIICLNVSFEESSIDTDTIQIEKPKKIEMLDPEMVVSEGILKNKANSRNTYRHTYNCCRSISF